MADKNFGTEYLIESLEIHEPINKLKAKSVTRKLVENFHQKKPHKDFLFQNKDQNRRKYFH